MTVRLGAGHQAWPRGGHLRRFRSVLGLVLAAGPDDCRLADAGHRIHRHDGGPRHIRRAPWLHPLSRSFVLMGVIVLNGRYWTFEKLALLFCALNLIYIPGAFLVHPSVQDVVHQGLIPNLAAGSTASCSSSSWPTSVPRSRRGCCFLPAKCGRRQGHAREGHPVGSLRHLLGSIVTVVVAVFIVVVTGTVLPASTSDSASQAARRADEDRPLPRSLLGHWPV